MTVYVNDCEPRRQFRNIRNKVWCYMIADSEDELHAMAERVGIKRQWFQERSPISHYDVTPKRRAKVVASGAIALSSESFRRKSKELGDARRKCVCGKSSCGVYRCDHCRQLQPACCGAYDDIERNYGATCDGCASKLGKDLDANIS